jgi:oligopeptide/dipeptide ABC transporter ATP-binding protein
MTALGPLPTGAPPLVDIRGLRIGIGRGRSEPLIVVDDATFKVGRGEMLGLIGESGSGKTMVCRSLIGTLHRRGARILSGTIRLGDVDLAHGDEAIWRSIRGRRVGYVPQSALAGLNPVMTVGAQLAEAIAQSPDAKAGTTPARAKELLEVVRIRRPEIVLKQHPNQLSGGMRQRVMIACAIAAGPEVLVADEPTTGLDVTVQAEIMKLLRGIRAEMGTSIILVSHDLALVDDVCDRVVVMHAGACVESGPVEEMARPLHPYTRALNRSRIELAASGSELVTIKGQPPAVGAWPPGCRFAGRCEIVQPDCRSGKHPPLFGEEDGHRTACLHPDLMESAS